MTDKQPQGAVEAAKEIRLRLKEWGYPYLSDYELDAITAIIAEKVRPMVESATLVDNDFQGNNPILRDSLEQLRAALNKWKGEE